jgi:hypothetical protein
MPLSGLSKALLFFLSLAARPAMAGNSIIDDSLEWNNPEEYTVSDWGPELYGLQIRAIVPCEIAFGNSLSLRVEQKLSEYSPLSKESLWKENPHLVGFRVECVDNPCCPIGSVDGIIDSITQNGILLTFPISESQQYLAGRHRIRLSYMADRSKEVEMFGRAGEFELVIRPELVVRKKLVLIMPKRFGVLDKCHIGYDFRSLDTIVVWRRLGMPLALEVARLLDYRAGPAYAKQDTFRLENTEDTSPLSPDGKKLHVGVNSALLFIAVSEGDIGLRGGNSRTLWRRKFELHINPTQLDALRGCPH